MAVETSFKNSRFLAKRKKISKVLILVFF